MYLMLMIRNNNAYIDQAKAQAADDDPQIVAAICEEFLQRCALTVENAGKVDDHVYRRYASMDGRKQGGRGAATAC